VDRVAQVRVGDRHVLVHEVAGDVEDAAEHLLADGHGDRLAGVGEGHAALEAVGGGHGDRAHPAVAEVLLDFEHELGVHAVEDVLDLQGVVDFAGSLLALEKSASMTAPMIWTMVPVLLMGKKLKWDSFQDRMIRL
jgi:hypothetical protein